MSAIKNKKPAYNESIQYREPGIVEMKYGLKPPITTMQRFTKGLEPYCSYEPDKKATGPNPQ